MEKLKVEFKEWSHTCADGCCHTWGMDVFINGEKISDGDFNDSTTIVLDVLKHLGYEVELEYLIEEDE